MKELINQISNLSEDRFSFCTQFINQINCIKIAELGVFRGEFAEVILKACPNIEKYTMIDPWRNLSDWNKPANSDNSTFDEYFKETLVKTEFAKNKREVLRGKTTEVIDQIESDAFDLVYVDGDHTLKGISIDLINIWPKVQSNGFIIGDDFSASIWQHSLEFEPTMVFPFAVYFAEAVNVKIYALPHNQFLISKAEQGFEFIDLTNGNYDNLELRLQFIDNSSTNNINNQGNRSIISRIKSILKG